MAKKKRKKETKEGGREGREEGRKAFTKEKQIKQNFLPNFKLYWTATVVKAACFGGETAHSNRTPQRPQEKHTPVLLLSHKVQGAGRFSDRKIDFTINGAGVTGSPQGQQRLPAKPQTVYKD
jgi:hypothetical protein